MGSPFPVLAFLLAWMVVPLICMLVLQLPGWIFAVDRAELSFFWRHIDLIVALCWACVFVALVLSSPHFDWKHSTLRAIAGGALFVIFFCWVAGGSIGGLALGLFNCTADRSEGQEAPLKQLEEEGRSVTFHIEAPFAATFKCGLAAMNTGYREGKRFYVHPGRLGAVWGEFR